MGKTILFSSSGSSDSNYTLTILSGEFDLKNQTGYVKIDDNKKMFTKIYNLVLNALDAKEHSIDKLTEAEEDLLYGTEVDHDIIVPIIFLEKPFMVYGEVIKLKEKHIVKEHVPTKFVVTDKNPNTINVNDENIIVINYDFVSGKELSFIEGREVCETGKDFETNCLDFFSPHLLDIYCDVVVVKKDKSYISLKDLLANNDSRYTVKHMREAHNTHKLLVSGIFEFKPPHNIYLELYGISYDNNLVIDKKTFTKLNINNERISFLIEKANKITNTFIYNCNTNIFITKDVLYMLNNKQPYEIFDEKGKAEITKEDIEKV